MATRSQVLSMFGATPEQIRQRQLEEQQAFLRSASGDPYQLAGGALGLGLARLFGGKSEQLTQAEQLQERLKGIDVNSPDALREAAKSVADIAPEQALQIASYARQLEREQMAPIINLPIQVGTKPKYMLNPLTQEYERVGEEPIIRDVPFERLPSGLRSLDPRYSLDMVDKETLGKLNFPSDEAAAMVNQETALLDARKTQRDASGTIIGVMPQPAAPQPTLDMPIERTGPAIPPTSVIQGTPVSMIERLRTELATVNRQLTGEAAPKLSKEKKDALIERRKDLMTQLIQQYSTTRKK